MKRILATLKEKWPEYLLEIIVLIIGIYGALAMDNWNEGRKEKQKEKDYVLRFIQDLKRDTTNFSLELTNTKSKYLESKAAYQFVTDSYLIRDTTAFLIALQDIGRTNKPRINKNTYDDLVSTGTSSIITDKEVLDDILTYYNEIPTEWFDKEYLDRMWKGYLPLSVKALDLDLLEAIINQDSTAAESTKVKYDINISKIRAKDMLKRFKSNPDIEFEMKHITRTHLVHTHFLTNNKTKAKQLIHKLENYFKRL